MDISFSEQLKRLRKAKGNTQVELAAHIGITTQAVSKWERGEGYPDITLLPAIAAYYGASIDDLLGVGEFEKEKKRNAYREKNEELFREGKSAERVALMREALREFPNDLSVIADLMWALSAEDRAKNADEIIACGERIVEESTDSKLRNDAVQALAFTYYYGKNDAETAIRYAKTAPNYAITVNQMLPRFLEGEEAVEYCQKNLQTLFDDVKINAQLMYIKGEYPPEDVIRVNEFLIGCFNLLYSDGNCGFYHTRYAELYEESARNCLLIGDTEKAIACLAKAADHAVSFDTRKDGAYTAFMVNKVAMLTKNTYRSSTENDSCLLLRFLRSDKCAQIWDDPRVKRIVAKLEPVAKE